VENEADTVKNQKLVKKGKLMKITKSQLKQIIKEELESVVQEASRHDDYVPPVRGYRRGGEERYRAKRRLEMAINGTLFAIETLKSYNKAPQSVEQYHKILDSLASALRTDAVGDK
jgi:hypothetical protein